MSPERREWLAQWKERAVSRLPLTAPVEAKVQLRRQVEKALHGHGPDDSSAEIEDIVAVLAQHIGDQIGQAEKDQERQQQKLELLELAETILEIVIGRCPIYLVGSPRSLQRQQVLTSLRPKLRTTLEGKLTGEESVDQVIRQVTEWVAAWTAEQRPEPWRKSAMRNTVKAAARTVPVLNAAMQVPEVRDVLVAGSLLLGKRIVGLLQRKPQNPPAAQRDQR